MLLHSSSGKKPVILETYSQGKSTLKLNSSPYEKCEYGHSVIGTSN